MPYIAKGLYAYGNLGLAIDVKTTKVVATRHQHRPAIEKVRSQEIS